MIAKILNYLILAGVIIILIFIWRRYAPSNNIETGGDTLTSIITYKYDTTVYHVDRVNIYHYSTDSIFLPVKVDTSQVIKDYFTKYVYSDTIRDTNILATITDTVFKNSILHRAFDYRLLRPTQIITTTIVAPAMSKIYLEGITGLNKDQVTQLTLKLDFFTKKNQLLTGGWDLKNHSVIAGWGIRLK